ncbi:EAL domain-containing protein [Massilia sp. IC2-476]|uniref:EAL domain-containing protein n=1 Tax=Massilia sp. IC2-476 TaxID=2887199 RepID=UPI001D10E300|nr:EAL domain-containing protein [Massilia sp. IC2-476]MCC2973634.1 EAL domain-containing protein [Massilia sp. IC2-476]
MRNRLILGTSILVALASAMLLPWLAWREAQRQAFEAAADMTRAYARAVLHRADKTSTQGAVAIRELIRQPHAPCSPQSLALMRRLDLSSTYIQAVGFVRGGVVVCSSMGTDPLHLGTPSLRTSTGYTIYPRVPIAALGPSPLMALERAGFVVLVHRELPLDISTSIPGAALAVLHLEAASGSAPELARGHVERAWLARLGSQRETSFSDGKRLIVLSRSRQFLTVAAAAVPLAYVQERAASIAWRLVPAAAVAGLLVAAAVLTLARQQRSIPAALRHALRRNEFYLQYQPIVELASGRCVGVEALLRWKRATGEQIGPDLFIPVAEQSGLITRLTERVFTLVEADAGAYLGAHPDFHVAINLSAADLQSSAIVDLVDRFLHRSGAWPSNLILEITERGFLDLDNALRVLGALRARGIEVAIDDFGTGYSSLSYLESLELDFLKIDRSFIEALGTKAPTSQVVGHIIAMARTMGLRMIAEGVESQVQADFLKGQAVQYAQGWLFGRPMSFTEAVRLATPHPERTAGIVA